MSKQLTITKPNVTHAWVTFYEDARERRQRKVKCLRSERGLAITRVSHGNYAFTHVPTGHRISSDDIHLSDKEALSRFDDVASLADWSADLPNIKSSELVRLGLRTS